MLYLMSNETNPTEISGFKIMYRKQRTASRHIASISIFSSITVFIYTVTLT